MFVLSVTCVQSVLKTTALSEDMLRYNPSHPDTSALFSDSAALPEMDKHKHKHTAGMESCTKPPDELGIS